MFVGKIESGHVGMAFEKRVNRLPQLADPFAVNDAHAQNSPRPALRQIIEHQFLHFARLKRVQVQHAINRQLKRLVVHSGI